jgi:predicted ArsR family transcriptional regulator
MATKTSQEVGELTYDNIVNFVREHEDPCVTASEIADAFGISNAGARWRLKRLKKRGKLRDKKVGASAKVWYLSK